MDGGRKLLLLMLVFVATTDFGYAIDREDYDRAEVAYRAREFDKAIAILEVLLVDSLQTADRSIIYDALILSAKCQTHLFDMSKALILFRKAEYWARESDDKEQIAGAINAQSIIFRYQKKFDKMYALNEKIFAMEGVPPPLISDAYTLKAKFYDEKHAYDSTEYYLEKAINLDLELNDSSSLPVNFMLLGKFYATQGKSRLAIENLLISEGFIRKGRDSFKIPPIYASLSDLFFKQLNFKKAYWYAKKAYDISNQLGITNTKANMAFVIAKILRQEEKYDEALAFLDTAVVVFAKNKAYKSLVNTLSVIAFCEVQKGEMDIASDNLQRAATLIADEDIRVNETCEFNLAKAALYWHAGKKKEAFSQWEKVITLAVAEKNPYDKLIAIEWIYRYYKSVGDLKNALSYFEEYKVLNDSLYQIARHNAILDLEEKYENEKYEKKVTKLQAENDIKKLEIAQSKVTVIMTSLGIMVLIVLLGVIFYFYFAKSKVLREIADKNRIIADALDEKEILIREIHHRVKNNLQVVSSLLSLQTEYISNPSALEAIIEGRNRVRSMALIHQLLYKENNLMTVRTLDYFPKLFLELFETYNISTEKIELRTDIVDINLDIETLIPIGLIINELVSNALKYAFKVDKPGWLAVSLSEKAGNLVIEVADNGIGSGMADNREAKTGFGYQLIRALVKKLNGTMKIDNSVGTSVKLAIFNYKKS